MSLSGSVTSLFIYFTSVLASVPVGTKARTATVQTKKGHGKAVIETSIQHSS